MDTNTQSVILRVCYDKDCDGAEKLNKKEKKKNVAANCSKSLSSVSLPAILGDYNIFRRATCISSCRVSSRIYSEGTCHWLMNAQYSYDSVLI